MTLKISLTSSGQIMPRTWRKLMGRVKHGCGYVTLTKANIWQAHWFPYVTDTTKAAGERRQHRTQLLKHKSEMRKFEAEEALRLLQRPSLAPTRDKEHPTVENFIQYRWLPLREGRWRTSTARSSKELIKTINEKFGSLRLAELSKVDLQVWINELAKTKSKSVVLHIRTFLKSICAEAVEQDYLTKNPARLLMTPLNLRQPDDTVLGWAEYQAVLLDLGPRDRLIVKVAGACAVRPSELFAFKWRCLQQMPNGRYGLFIQQTVYRGELRDYGKTQGSMNVVAIPTLLAEELVAMRQEAKYNADDDFIFADSRGGTIWKENFLKRVIYPCGRSWA